MAETSSPDPNYPNFSPFLGFDNPDPFIQRAFLWQNGVLTDLGAFIDSSQAYAVNAKGVAVGVSENGLIDPLNGLLAVHAVIGTKVRSSILERWKGGMRVLRTTSISAAK
jgi:uncharacterized membrane protein